MARQPRFNIPDIPQHVLQRGNNRDPCFFSSQDCRFCLESLHIASEKSCCAIHAYVLIRAGLMQAPGHYPWTSYRHTA